jgi:hypothetical protein
VTEAKLVATPARTWLIRSVPVVLSRSPCHHVGGRAALLEQLCHRSHRWARVGEKQLQTRTEVVLARLAVAREGEPVLWTSPVTKWPYLAIFALSSKRIALVVSELPLCGRGDEL